MIQVLNAQSRLSGWGHYAEPKTLTINKVPSPFVVGETVDISVTRSARGLSLFFTDGTVLDYLVGDSLLPTFNQATIWSVPAEGSTIPAGLDYVEIHASYTTKSGKIINAVPAKVPVAVPTEMRIAVPEEPLIREGRYLNTGNSWYDYISTITGNEVRGVNNAMNINASVYVYWKVGTKLVAITEVEKPRVYSGFWSSSYSAGNYSVGVGEISQSATFTRYQSSNDEGEEITLENAAKIILEATVKGYTLQTETYFQTNPIVEWGYFNLPTTYETAHTETVTVEANSRVRFKDGVYMVGRYDGLFYLPIFFRYQTSGGWYESVTSDTFSVGDDIGGTIKQYSLETRVDGTLTYKTSDDRQYYCFPGTLGNPGAIVWSEVT